MSLTHISISIYVFDIYRYSFEIKQDHQEHTEFVALSLYRHILRNCNFQKTLNYIF